MLAEFEQAEANFGIEKMSDIKKACRYLIRNQFVYSGDRGTAAVYNTLTDSRFRHLVADFFACLGYRIQSNAEEQWIGVLFDDEDAASAPKLRLDETIAVLVLASHWQEDADVGNLQDRAVSLTTLNVLHERYRDMVEGAGKPSLTVGRFLDLLKEVASRNLVWIGDYDQDAQDREVEIRPMIKAISGSDALSRLESYVSSEERSARIRANPGAGQSLLMTPASEERPA